MHTTKEENSCEAEVHRCIVESRHVSMKLYYQCVKLTCSLTGPAGLVKYFNNRPAVLMLDRVNGKVTKIRPP